MRFRPVYTRPEYWTGKPSSSILRPKVFSEAQIKATARYARWRERPLSKLKQAIGGATPSIEMSQ